MIGVDTNILLRLGDATDPTQRERARAFVDSQGAGGCLIGAIALTEFAWTLTRAYKRPRGEVAERIGMLLRSLEFQVADAGEASRALSRFRQGPADFADYFLAEINRSAGCSRTATFDHDALKADDLFAPVPELI